MRQRSDRRLGRPGEEVGPGHIEIVLVGDLEERQVRLDTGLVPETKSVSMCTFHWLSKNKNYGHSFGLEVGIPAADRVVVARNSDIVLHPVVVLVADTAVADFHSQAATDMAADSPAVNIEVAVAVPATAAVDKVAAARRQV